MEEMMIALDGDAAPESIKARILAGGHLMIIQQWVPDDAGDAEANDVMFALGQGIEAKTLLVDQK